MEQHQTASKARDDFYNIRDYGAVGDGFALDSDAVNSAIDAASRCGGGTVLFPAGIYLCYSIRLRSHITLLLAAGAMVIAAYPSPPDRLGYDEAEPSPAGACGYQDFGHSHWRNSLIWGADLENVAITGFGRIDGRGLCGAHHIQLPGEEPSPFAAEDGYSLAERPLQGNKAIALLRCRNVTLRDFSVFRGGHFALLATGIDNLTIDNLKVDTNRDGLDIDACRNVRVSNCSVNSPHDDAITLKSSFALGELRATENVTIVNCQVSGYEVGSLLDGSFDRSFEKATDQDGPTGRIKLGTESAGGFKHIAIANCLFDRCRGLAIETVDGGPIEDVSVSNVVMRDIVNSPLFLRIGSRGRAPDSPPAGSLRRVRVHGLTVYQADARYASQIVGLPEQPVEGVRLSDIRIVYTGGLSLDQVAEQPEELTNSFFLKGTDSGAMGPRNPFETPEQARAYPEPSMFGLLPAYGLYARHCSDVELFNTRFETLQPDSRPAVVLDDAQTLAVDRFQAQTDGDAPVFAYRNTQDFSTFRVTGVEDGARQAGSEWNFLQKR